MFSFYEQLTFIKWDKFLVVVVVSVTGLFMKNRNPFLIPVNPASTKKVIHPSQISMSERSITWQQFCVRFAFESTEMIPLMFYLIFHFNFEITGAIYMHMYVIPV